MRVVSINANRLVIHNGHTYMEQERWATALLGFGMIGIYFLASKVAGNLILLWLGILGHIFCFILVYWYFAPVKTTFDKIKGSVVIEGFNLLTPQVTEYTLSDIWKVQVEKRKPINIGSVVCLVLISRKCLYLNNFGDDKKDCQEVAYIIKKFLSS